MTPDIDAAVEKYVQEKLNEAIAEAFDQETGGEGFWSLPILNNKQDIPDDPLQIDIVYYDGGSRQLLRSESLVDDVRSVLEDSPEEFGYTERLTILAGALEALAKEIKASVLPQQKP